MQKDPGQMALPWQSHDYIPFPGFSLSLCLFSHTKISVHTNTLCMRCFGWIRLARLADILYMQGLNFRKSPPGVGFQQLNIICNRTGGCLVFTHLLFVLFLVTTYGVSSSEASAPRPFKKKITGNKHSLTPLNGKPCHPFPRP